MSIEDFPALFEMHWDIGMREACPSCIEYWLEYGELPSFADETLLHSNIEVIDRYVFTATDSFARIRRNIWRNIKYTGKQRKLSKRQIRALRSLQTDACLYHHNQT